MTETASGVDLPTDRRTSIFIPLVDMSQARPVGAPLAYEPPPVVDVSRHQGTLRWAVAASRGVRLAAIRATVGDYYIDPALQANWLGARGAGLETTVYHVTTPEKNKQAQMDWFERALARLGIVPAHAVVIDNELDRGQSRQTVTACVEYCFARAADKWGKAPLNYTRQTWWDACVLPSSKWERYLLWAARYANLNGPWADGLFRFRDYDDWFLHQRLADGDGLGAAYGAESNDIDLSWANGGLARLAEWLAVGAGGGEDEQGGERPDALIAVAEVVAPVNLRREPRLSYTTLVGQIEKPGALVPVYEMRQDITGIWARLSPLSPGLWCAIQWGGRVYLETIWRAEQD